MAALSETIANATLDALLTDDLISELADTLYIGLSFTAIDTNDGSGWTEPSGDGYDRVEITKTTDFDAADSRVAATNTDVVFPEATADWGLAVAILVFDVSTAGDPVMWAPLTSPVQILNGQEATFVAGDIKVRLR